MLIAKNLVVYIYLKKKNKQTNSATSFWSCGEENNAQTSLSCSEVITLCFVLACLIILLLASPLVQLLQFVSKHLMSACSTLFLARVPSLAASSLRTSRLLPTAATTPRAFSTSATLHKIQAFAATSDSTMSYQSAKVLKTIPLEDADAKWVGLKAIEWVDPSGKQRKWESADRKTRKGDVDAVAIMTIIHRPSAEPHILLISQYRPPVGKSCIEMPAGLIDAGEEGDEGINRAALRELEEETGYGTDKEGGKVKIEETTPKMFNDPGLTGANMKMVVVNIELSDDAKEPVAKLEEGEFIEKYLVPVKGLYQSLKGKSAILDSSWPDRKSSDRILTTRSGLNVLYSPCNRLPR